MQGSKESASRRPGSLRQGRRPDPDREPDKHNQPGISQGFREDAPRGEAHWCGRFRTG